MMNKKILILTVLLIISISKATAQGKNKSFERKEFGIQYVLPKSCVYLQIKSKKTNFTPGELSQYAERYLKMSDVPTEAFSKWEFVDARLYLSAKPDSSKVYFVPMTDKMTTPLMELTPEGIIKSINMPISSTQEIVSHPAEDKIVVTKAAKTLDPHSFLNEDILMAGSTSKMAELVAKEIYNIRDSRNELVRGQADNLPKDGAQLKLMLENLDAQEKALVSMFTGSYSYEEKTQTMPVPINETKGDILFRFSQAFGVVGKNDLSGRPFYLVLNKQKSTDLMADAKIDEKLLKDGGVAYNIPGRAIFTIFDGTKQIVQQNFPVTQFGSIEYLAYTLFEKKTTVSVKFDPMTGALLKIDRINN